MGRMRFNIIPRDGKKGDWFGEAAEYDGSSVGRYELYIDDYADDVCEGEVQTARRAYCENASPLLAMWISAAEHECNAESTLGEIAGSMRKHISDIDEFFKLCDLAEVEYETLPLLIDKHEY